MEYNCTNIVREIRIAYAYSMCYSLEVIYYILITFEVTVNSENF